MKLATRSLGSLIRHAVSVVCDTQGNQLAEFAVSLPILIVVAVGIFDFGAAFTVKEKLVGVAQIGARVGASQPSNDLTVTSTSCNALVSVCAVRDVVARAMTDDQLKTCGLATKAPTAGPGNLTWTITANSGCASPVIVKIERGFVYTTTLSPPFDTTPFQIVATRVTLTYPYQWQFDKVAGLFGGNFTGPTQLSTVAVMQNLN